MAPKKRSGRAAVENDALREEGGASSARTVRRGRGEKKMSEAMQQWARERGSEFLSQWLGNNSSPESRDSQQAEIFADESTLPATDAELAAARQWMNSESTNDDTPPAPFPHMEDRQPEEFEEDQTQAAVPAAWEAGEEELRHVPSCAWPTNTASKREFVWATMELPPSPKRTKRAHWHRGAASRLVEVVPDAIQPAGHGRTSLGQMDLLSQGQMEQCQAALNEFAGQLLQGSIAGQYSELLANLRRNDVQHYEQVPSVPWTTPFFWGDGMIDVQCPYQALSPHHAGVPMQQMHQVLADGWQDGSPDKWRRLLRPTIEGRMPGFHEILALAASCPPPPERPLYDKTGDAKHLMSAEGTSTVGVLLKSAGLKGSVAVYFKAGKVVLQGPVESKKILAHMVSNWTDAWPAAGIAARRMGVALNNIPTPQAARKMRTLMV
ncbi:unnamed protein product [Polarella glacialis]|uniref:Uncharacterized protein n=2 Tax=Polarella glacialis TaxID=89957 RepID=A0A813K5U2_POLGL|nr:unnamed protein product [Polarella glacialis]